jgi:hypothetical protein
MATREELIKGLEFTVEQGKRTTALFAEGEWDARRDAGWTPKELYSHLAATAAIVPQLGAGLLNASEDTDISAGLDINAMNAQSVGAMQSMTPEQVMQAFETNYRNLIDYIKGVPDEQLTLKRRFLSESIPVGDIIGNAVMLHGIHHVYEAAARPLPQ